MRKFSILIISIIFLTGCTNARERRIVIKKNRFFLCESASNIQKKMVQQINHIRNSKRRCGKRTFAAARTIKWNSKLTIAAQGHAKDMAWNDRLSHTGSDGSSVRARVERSGYRWQIVAENIAAGRQDSEQVLSSWLESPGHCANLMNPDVTDIGAACFRNKESRYGTYWALVMAASGD
jgi:uncharacterized protein YkwD